MQGQVIQINLSGGGLPKRPVEQAELTPLGFQGDRVGHAGIHGGPRKAVLIVCAETVDALVARGFPLYYGALGENLTVRGLDPAMLRPGQQFQVGGALLELTTARVPCRALDVYGRELQVELAGGPGGFYASVIRAALVRTGDSVKLLSELA